MDELKRSLNESRNRGTKTVALVIINPGNPTGQVLEESNMRAIIDFCYRERLSLLADEVYQTNIYLPQQRPFVSFKKVLYSMDPKYHDVPLFSFHSASKGMVGECGRRGGFVECSGVPRDVLFQMYKVASVNLCPNVLGQVTIDLMVRPPRAHEVSHAQYQAEYHAIYESLKQRALVLQSAFNHLEGVTCNPAQGAMYLFPRIRLSDKAIAAARTAKKEPDTFYCLAMLNETGVVRNLAGADP